MAEERVQRRLAAILAADVVGYSRMMERDEAGTLARMKSLRSEILDPKTKQFGGRIFKDTGDGALAEFASAVDAVHCAVEILRDAAGGDAGMAEDQKIRLRIGISQGDVIVDGDDLYGNGVNVAARMEGLAEPGGVCVSGNVFEHVGNALPFNFEDLGERTVKNIDRPVRVYRVSETYGTAARRDERPVSLPDKPSIAVLPFQNLSGDPDQEYFSDGISEDITTALSRIRQFFVIARNTSFTFKGRAVDVQAIAKDLGVRFVLEGSVRKAGNRVRITAQLIDGETGNHIWAEKYDRALDDIFEIQDEITQTVVGTIEPELSRFEQDRARLKPIENLDAWDLYQKGLWHLWRRTESDNAEATRLFESACALDPEFSGAYAHLAYAHFQLYTLDPALHPEAVDRVLAAARQAMSADDRDALAHWAMGGAHILNDEFELAMLALKRSIEINPSLAVAHMWLAEACSETGDPEQAFERLDTALRLSPRDPLESVMLYLRAKIHLSLGNYEQAENWARRSLQRSRFRQMAHLALLAALGHLGKTSEIEPAFASMAELFPQYAEITEEFLLTQRLIQANVVRDQLIEGLRKADMLKG